MSVELFVTWVIVGLFTGWLAGIVMKDGGRGRAWDLVFGLIGSGAASGIYWALAGSQEAGKFAMAVIAFVGAALVMVAQRKVGQAHA